MARLINPLFGNLSGRVGDFVFMTRNGKTFMYYRPKLEKKKSNSENDDYEYQKRPNNPFNNNFFKKTKES
ncbi:MAG: hypothetical protein WC139_04785 [Candidatus Kapaibacterium sp.]